MSKKSIAIVDYGMGNLRSVAKAFEVSGARVKVTDRLVDIENADKIVLPGVGAYTAALRELHKRGLVGALKRKIAEGTPYLGLCLGLQLLFDKSEENTGQAKFGGFGVVPGEVKRFRGGLKVPHMGWNTLKLAKKDCPLFHGIKADDYFYFVHSFYGAPADKSWNAALTRYGLEFTSAVWKGNVFATQFHPEKSQSAGLRVIKNFVDHKA